MATPTSLIGGLFMPTNDFSVEVYKSIIERSGQMVRYCFLMNGGAVVALLAFLGQVWGQRVDIDASRINTVVLWFVFGLVAGVVASIADYIALSRLYQEQEHGARRGVNEWFAWVSLLLVAISLVLFGVGAVLSAEILAEGATWDASGWQP
jgi:hypothetical protein